MIKLDGSYMEGGGSIVRQALALSTITQKPFEVDNIRQGRATPGLKNQHLHGIKALEKLCSAKTEGVSLASTHLKYWPNKIESKNLDIDIGTSGSITLLLQSLLIPSIFADKPLKITIIGGTEGKFAQPFDYFNEVFLPQLRRFADIEVRLLKRGYYPKGNGKIELKIKQKFHLNDFNNFEDFHKQLKENIPRISLTEQHNLIQIKGISHASFTLQKANVAERQTKTAELILKNKYSCPVNIGTAYNETLSTGSGIALWAVFSKDEDEIDITNPIRIGSDSLGERGKKAEIVGQQAASNLINEIESKAPVDHYLADQILSFMALTGKSKIKTSKITSHCKTNIYVIEQFLGKTFEVDEKENVISTID